MAPKAHVFLSILLSSVVLSTPIQGFVGNNALRIVDYSALYDDTVRATLWEEVSTDVCCKYPKSTHVPSPSSPPSQLSSLCSKGF